MTKPVPSGWPVLTSPRWLRPRSGRAGFSLVEMLAVLGIIAILAAVSLPSIIGMSRAARGSTGASLVMAAFDQARNTAISQATPAYLVMATSDAAWPADYRGRAFAIFTEVYVPKAQVSQAYQQVPVTKWQVLPDTVGFKPDLDTVYGAPISKFYFPPANLELPVAVIKFTPTGAIEQPIETKYARVRLFDGYFNSQGTPVPVSRSGAAGEYNLRLTLFTGRALLVDPLHPS